MSQRNGQEWRNAEYLIDILGNYPRKVKVKVNNGTGDQNRIARFDQLIGKWVSVGFDIDAHEYQGRWFNELTSWGIREYAPTRVPEITQPVTSPEAGTAAMGAETQGFDNGPVPSSPVYAPNAEGEKTAAESPEPTNEGGDGLPF